MPVEEPSRPIRIEPRWPVVLTVLVLLMVLTILQSRIRLAPSWSPYAIAIMLVLPMIGVWLSGGHSGWLRVERTTMLIFAMIAEAVTLITLLYLIIEMRDRRAGISDRQLLASSLSGWFTNVIVFSMLYWHIDCGGPEAQANDADRKPDWFFPQTGAPEVAPPDWRPTYVDYLFLSFTAATAFSPTDVLPLTPRAKILMMLESAVSLSTLVVVASRAINLLGS
jgi:uncharacterized membrane protein